MKEFGKFADSKDPNPRILLNEDGVREYIGYCHNIQLEINNFKKKKLFTSNVITHRSQMMNSLNISNNLEN